MSLFDPDAPFTATNATEATDAEPERRRPSRRTRWGIGALAVALAGLAALTFLPTGYVIENPGPVFNTLGEVKNAQGDTVPLISVDGAPTYPSTGTLDLLTVTVTGNPDRTPSWFDLVQAWFDPSRAVVPMSQVYPSGTTTEERNEENAQLMTNSQQDATAAALSHLGYDIDARLSVYSLPENSPATGVLEKDDIIRTADGVAVPYISQLRAQVQKSAGKPMTLGIERGGQAMTVEATPTFAEKGGDDGNGAWQIGVSILPQYTFPVKVQIQLDNVGGPSAGQMFALGIIDTLTEGDLTGGTKIAGTGTIDGEGNVGAIGGIRQKLYGARDAGATDFLAPASNCDEVVGHVPSGIRVFSVSTLDDSLKVLETIRDGGDLDALPTCTAG